VKDDKDRQIFECLQSLSYFERALLGALFQFCRHQFIGEVLDD
jgi:hypothetical protein